MTYTGMQMAGCAVMCLAAGIGIGFFGWQIVEEIANRRESARQDGCCTFGRYA